MDYEIKITKQANRNLDNILDYLEYQLQNEQALLNVLEDFKSVLNLLKSDANKMPLCKDTYLSKKGYHKINLRKHKYYIFYIVKDKTVIIHGIYHMRENYKLKLN